MKRWTWASLITIGGIAMTAATGAGGNLIKGGGGAGGPVFTGGNVATGVGGAGGSSATYPEAWTAVLTISASSFEGMKRTADIAVQGILRAKTFQELPLGWGGGGGGLGAPSNFSSFSAVYTSPLVERIKELRKEADRLEQELKRSEKKP